jgi:hypothetical protein
MRTPPERRVELGGTQGRQRKRKCPEDRRQLLLTQAVVASHPGFGSSDLSRIENRKVDVSF